MQLCNYLQEKLKKKDEVIKDQRKIGWVYTLLS